MSDVRVRLAPSPTGPPHVGTAYTALFNLAFARQQGGQFILRIEDTDQERSRPEYETRLMAALRWLGIDWDEGPDIGGPHAPYRQSERLEIYQKYAGQLVEQGHAYPCFCTSERLAEVRAEQRRNKQQQLGYDGHCRDLASPAVTEKLAAGQPHVIRLKMPREGTCVLNDVLRDPISFEYSLLDDQVLLKSDGFPTYHLAVVVDDHLMGITHVIRGEEWISSAPKHLLLYQCFGWDPPVYVHQPLLLNPDGSKLSKRRNPTSIDYYRMAGYLGPALRNFLGLMTLAPPDGEDKFSFEQMVEHFDLKRIRLGGCTFDIKKLDWLNARYLREDLEPGALLREMKQWLLNDEYVEQMIPLMHDRMETMGDFMAKCAFFFSRRVEYEAEDLVPKKRDIAEVAPVLQTMLWALDKALPWNRDTVEAAVQQVSAFWEWPIRDLTGTLFVAVMGQRVGPPLYESVALLAVDMTRVRLLQAMEKLGGLSKKKSSKLQADWEQAQSG